MPVFTLASGDLRQHLPVFQMLFDAIQIGISITDASGVIVYCNDALAQMDNVPKREIVGRSMFDVYEYTQETSPVMQVLRSGQAMVDKVNSYRTRSGNLVNAACTIYPLYTEDDALCGAMCYTQDYAVLNTHFHNVQHSLAEVRAGEAGGVAYGGAPGAAGRGAGRAVASTAKSTAKSTAESTAERSRALGVEGRPYTFESFVGANELLCKALDKAERAARSASSIMLVGETGVGKELFAQSVHAASPRRQAPYTALNCSAIPETLLEGILFGTTKGAFTGAEHKAGLFEASHKGTLFLDEVDSMPPGLQSKLLRVLQEQRVRRLGDTAEREVDVRLISAVGRQPDVLLHERVLRPDFYYRLGVVKVFIPPLRERMDDLDALTGYFLAQTSRALCRPVPRVDAEVMACLRRHTWPGNVRELAHVVEAVLNMLDQQMEIRLEHLAYACPELVTPRAFVPQQAPLVSSAPPLKPEAPDAAPVAPFTNTLNAATREAEQHALRKALEKAAGKQALAARLLGISPQLFRHKLKKYQLDPAHFIPDVL